MKLAILSLLALATDAVLGREANCSSSNNLTVQTSTGTYTGLVDSTFPNTRQFRAIPFAKPPVLSRRWLPPQKLSSPPSEHHYATRFPPSCPQFVTAVTSLWNQNLTHGNLIYNGNQLVEFLYKKPIFSYVSSGAGSFFRSQRNAFHVMWGSGS